jgi:hypothetical protein
MWRVQEEQGPARKSEDEGKGQETVTWFTLMIGEVIS